MMLKKFGVVTVGVTAGLLMAAPLASATESHDSDSGSDSGSGQTCEFTGGTASAVSDISGDSAANAVAQAPIAGSNIGNIADCSNILNDNVNGNHVNVSVLGDGLGL